jgi:hypothetical protein
MSDGARKEVADSTDSAAYFGPMSEAKQNQKIKTKNQQKINVKLHKIDKKI